MSNWIKTSKTLPNIDTGEELHCFIAKRRKCDNQVFIMDAYWVNKPLPCGIDNCDDIPDYILFNSDGEPVDMFGWCERGYHPDFDGYYQQIDERYCEIVAWQEIQYPALPVGY